VKDPTERNDVAPTDVGSGPEDNELKDTAVPEEWARERARRLPAVGSEGKEKKEDEIIWEESALEAPE